MSFIVHIKDIWGEHNLEADEVQLMQNVFPTLPHKTALVVAHYSKIVYCKDFDDVQAVSVGFE